MDKIDKQIIAGLVEFLTTNIEPEIMAEVLDDIYYIIAQNAVRDPQSFELGKHSLDVNMSYLHQLRDVLKGKLEPVPV